MKFSYLLIVLLSLVINGCSDFSSEANEFELSGKMYACDESVHGDIANDTKAGKKQYCNGLRWIDLIPEDSTVQNISNTQIMYECKNGAVVKFKNLCSEQPSDYLPLDDTEYPYAGIPRIVIETENHRAIKDRETEIPAKLQIWGEHAPESEIMELTIRGRGNTSWIGPPKKSYKIEFKKKQEMLGMHKDKDWALIANYADKTLMKNYIACNLSKKLHAYYTPKNQFIELFINKEYLGVYLLSETIKIGKHRVNILKDDFSYLVEIDGKHKDGEFFFISNGIDETGRPFRIHEPHNPSAASIDTIKSHINSFEIFLRYSPNKPIEEISKWIDIDEAIKHYWIQELTKNPDANFFTSVYFSWVKGESIKIGPIWDFDLSMGGHSSDSVCSTKEWYIRHYWYRHLFRNSEFEEKAKTFWKNNRDIFKNIPNTVDSLQRILQPAATNDNKRWKILESTRFLYHTRSFKNYSEATDYLKEWLFNRFNWIDNQYSPTK